MRFQPHSPEGRPDVQGASGKGAQSAGFSPAVLLHLHGSGLATSQLHRPVWLPDKSRHSTLPLSAAELPRSSGGVFTLLAPGATEQLVGGTGAGIRVVFYQTDNLIPQKACLLLSKPYLASSQSCSLVTCCLSQSLGMHRCTSRWHRPQKEGHWHTGPPVT